MEQETYKTYKKTLINNYKTALAKVCQENILNLKLEEQKYIDLEIINKEIYFIANEAISKHFDC
jgi:hypothetical protein